MKDTGVRPGHSPISSSRAWTAWTSCGRSKHIRPEVVVIVLTAYGTSTSPVVAMKAGAEDYITKPFNLDHIRLVVKKAMEKQELSHRNGPVGEPVCGKSIGSKTSIGNSEAMIKVYKIIERIKDSKATVLLRGETGSGKELVARAIHFNSVRSAHPFVPVNCAALGENLAGSELFGHEKGSFTGAFRDKRGIFEVAEGGTIFLDEIGNIGLGLQQVFLRVLEAGELQPVGSVERKKVSVRIVAATNKNLEQMVKDNAFREDLYYRISVVVVDLPSLRERKEDIGVLARHFLEKYARENSRRVPAISADALHLLEAYGWPGNVRELENVMERAVLLTEGEVVLPESLPPHMQDLLQRKNDGVSPDLSLERVGKPYRVGLEGRGRQPGEGLADARDQPDHALAHDATARYCGQRVPLPLSGPLPAALHMATSVALSNPPAPSQGSEHPLGNRCIPWYSGKIARPWLGWHASCSAFGVGASPTGKNDHQVLM